jgi:hypothetical protein
LEEDRLRTMGVMAELYQFCVGIENR